MRKAIPLLVILASCDPATVTPKLYSVAESGCLTHSGLKGFRVYKTDVTEWEVASDCVDGAYVVQRIRI